MKAALNVGRKGKSFVEDLQCEELEMGWNTALIETKSLFILMLKKMKVYLKNINEYRNLLLNTT